MQEGSISEFIEKEGKWFNYIRGLQGELDVSELNVQGLGVVSSVY
jgi:hypothetical protein